MWSKICVLRPPSGIAIITKLRVDADMVRHGQLLDINDKTVWMQLIRSCDLGKFGTRLVEDKAKLYLFYGAVHPRAVCTATLYI